MFLFNNLNSFFVLLFLNLFSFVCLDQLITEECLQCICNANTGCKPTNKCYEDSLGNIHCGLYLLKKSQWLVVKNLQTLYLNDNKLLNPKLDTYFNQNISFENSFELCFKSVKCSQNVLLAFANLNLIHRNQTNEKLTCADVALVAQLGTYNNSKVNLESSENKDYSYLIQSYKNILKNYNCMHKSLAKIENSIANYTNVLNIESNLNTQNKELFKISLKRVYSTGLLKNSNENLKIDLIRKNETKIDISLVPSRCFQCIRDANMYQKEIDQLKCIHPLQKCGPYAINFEYFLEANGNLVVKNKLPNLFNANSELENKDYFIDLLEFLNKNFNLEEKNLRKETNIKESVIKKDYYDKKLSKLIYEHDNLSKEQDEELEDKLKINRRNSKFSKNLQNYLEEIESKNSFNLNQLNDLLRNDLNLKKLINSASFYNFALCTLDLDCAETLINAFVSKHLLDCNLDSNIDCDDFAGIHWLGKNCKKNTMLYSNVWKNFEYCLILADDVRKETLPNTRVENIESNSLNHKHNNYLNVNELPPFIIRPLSLNLPTNTLSEISPSSINNENYFVNSDINQYYSSHVVDLSKDCLQCICEASSGYNCSKIASSSGPFSFYFSGYKLTQEGLLSPPPPQAVYNKKALRKSKKLFTNNFEDNILKNKKYSIYNELNSIRNKRSIKPLFLKNKNKLNYLQKRPKIFIFDDIPSDQTDFDLNHEIKFNENEGYGAFGLTKQNWIEAGAPMYRGAANDFDRCAESYECSIETISKFVTRFSMDCTKDGRLSCADFGLIHKFKRKCTDLNVLNTEYYRKFEKCQLKFNLH